jgi:A/G-specific adenine glycosylase
VSLPPVPSTDFQRTVLDWYDANGRDLAFRHTADPWAVLVSEVMAQQTQAARAAEAWSQFILRFPTPRALADASSATVIRAWRGLGYNRRALALRAAAVKIVDDHGGRVPDTLEALLRLPGVGPYTARAVLAIAFGRPVAALDVNIRRVLGRSYLRPGLPPRASQEAANSLVPRGRAAAWTHALMDIGAAFCRPREPRCDACPLLSLCIYANTRGAAGLDPGLPRRTQTDRFEDTTRWLRGRILDRLRDAPGWVAFGQAIGTHPPGAVAASLARLAHEGLIDLEGARARLVGG